MQLTLAFSERMIDIYFSEGTIYIYFSFVARDAQCNSMDVCMHAHDAGMLGHNAQLRQCI